MFRNTDASTRNTLSLVLDAAVVTSPFAPLGFANHRRLRMVAGWRNLYLRISRTDQTCEKTHFL